MQDETSRQGEELLSLDPATMAGDAKLVYIGYFDTPWKERSQCPKNLRQARERHSRAGIRLKEAYRRGLKDFAAGDLVIVLSWFDRAARNIIVQRPRMSEKSSGVFSLRSPVRPNPIGLHLVRITRIDRDAGFLEIDAIDLLDRTPVLDIKPYLPSIDMPPAETP